MSLFFFSFSLSSLVSSVKPDVTLSGVLHDILKKFNTFLFCLASPVVYYLSMTSIGQKDAKPAKTQVRAVESPRVLSLSLPHYVDPGSDSSAHGYHSLGHCLRNNIFPGAPLTWRSLSMDSYVSHPLTDWPADPDLWYGHKTDELVQWTERNIMNQKLNMKLTAMEKKKGIAK